LAVAGWQKAATEKREEREGKRLVIPLICLYNKSRFTGSGSDGLGGSLAKVVIHAASLVEPGFSYDMEIEIVPNLRKGRYQEQYG
jgi:hypothetical protein